jgi:hypothetical protein
MTMLTKILPFQNRTMKRNKNECCSYYQREGRAMKMERVKEPKLR